MNVRVRTSKFPAVSYKHETFLEQIFVGEVRNLRHAHLDIVGGIPESLDGLIWKGWGTSPSKQRPANGSLPKQLNWRNSNHNAGSSLQKRPFLMLMKCKITAKPTQMAYTIPTRSHGELPFGDPESTILVTAIVHQISTNNPTTIQKTTKQHQDCCDCMCGSLCILGSPPHLFWKWMVRILFLFRALPIFRGKLLVLKGSV